MWQPCHNHTHTHTAAPVHIRTSPQTLQAELRSCQQKQAQQQLSYESAIAVLQADLAALRSRVDDHQSNTQAAVDQLRGSLRLHMEQQRAENEEQLQVCS